MYTQARFFVAFCTQLAWLTTQCGLRARIGTCLLLVVFLQPLLHLSCKDISASEVTTLRRYTNLFIITIIIIFLTLGRYVPEGV